MPKLLGILETADAPGVLNMLSDTVYAEDLAEVRDESKFETVMTHELARTYGLFRDLSLDPELTDLFFLRNDVHNLKVLLKAKYAHARPDPYLLDPGLFESVTLKQMIEKEDFRVLPQVIQEGVREAMTQFDQRKNPQVVDIILDEALYSLLLETARSRKDSFLEELFRMEIDLTNLKTFVRLKIRARGREQLQEALLAGGFLPTERLLTLFDGTLEQFAQGLRNTRYGRAIADGIANWKEHAQLTYLEKLFDDYLLDYLKQAKYITFGLEPLVGYLLAKETEIRNIRTILVGKFNNLPKQQILERLRETYV
jgi:V/A-type H+-transporting ATPase subunit C